MLPFLVVGSISTILSILLIVTIPTKVTNSSSESVESSETKEEEDLDAENPCNSEEAETGEETPLIDSANVPNGSATTPHQVQLGYGLYSIEYGYDYKLNMIKKFFVLTCLLFFLFS